MRDSVSRHDFVSYVDPLIATCQTRWIFFSSACRPFGMVNLSPDTTAIGDWGAGYAYQERRIQAFSHVHAWQIAALPMMPTVGAYTGPGVLEDWEAPFGHEDEVAEAGYHRVELPSLKTSVEMTSTMRVGLTRFTFHQGGAARINFDLGAELGPSEMGEACIERVGRGCVEGYVTNLPTRRRPKPLKVYFVAEIDTPDAELITWKGETLQASDKPLTGEELGFAFAFNAVSGRPVQVKVAVAYTSVEQARKNLAAELPGWDFDRVRFESRDEWNRMLGRIRVDGGSEQKKIKFYTDLFHALLGRRTVSDVDGKYFDYTTSEPRIRQIPLDANGQPKHAHYNSDGMWGAQWAISQLWPLAYPEIASGFCQSFLDVYRNGGLIPRGPSGGNYTFVMTGASSTPLFVSAWQKGIRDFDIKLAYEGLRKNHMPGGLMSKAGYEHHSSVGGGIEHYMERGYVPVGLEADAFHLRGATQTLEYAFEDWALSELAAVLGYSDEAAYFAKRSENYRNIWNPQTGFMQPRRMDGSWLPDFDPMSPEGWVEGNGWQYLFRVPHAMDSLAELMGGRRVAVQRLDALMRAAEETGFIAPHDGHHLSPLDYGNQPSTFYAHLFNALGAPEMSQYWVRRVYDTCKSAVSPEGGYGGDEDQGLMGSLNCMFALGLFDIAGGCARNPGYDLTTPLFEHIEIDLNPDYYSGDKISIRCDASPEVFGAIKEVSLNGKSSDGLRVSHADLVAGAELRFSLCEFSEKCTEALAV